MKGRITLALTTAVAAACLLLGEAHSGKLGRSGLATGQPGMNRYPAGAPGSTSKLQRPYLGAPPLVPHRVADLEISRSQNPCLSCHAAGVRLGVGHEATKIPTSHYLNSYTGERQEKRVVGIRYGCLQCHVPQAAAEPPLSRAAGPSAGHPRAARSPRP